MGQRSRSGGTQVMDDEAYRVVVDGVDGFGHRTFSHAEPASTRGEAMVRFDDVVDQNGADIAAGKIRVSVMADADCWRRWS